MVQAMPATGGAGSRPRVIERSFARNKGLVNTNEPRQSTQNKNFIKAENRNTLIIIALSLHCTYFEGLKDRILPHFRAMDAAPPARPLMAHQVGGVHFLGETGSGPPREKG
jgi:hypothetical protein